MKKFEDRLMTTDECAAFFQSSPRTFRKYVGNHITKYREGSRIYYRLSDLGRWMDENIREQQENAKRRRTRR